ncbi:MAG: hypothetical protein DRN57_04380 [Thermoplasmata archaeon]|nr:MAG: hypothetical protein DRN57_04380 [Thermoplasmata archaeon]
MEISRRSILTSLLSAILLISGVLVLSPVDGEGTAENRLMERDRPGSVPSAPSRISYDGNTYYVGGPGNYTTIQEAVDLCVDGDVVVVNPGTYQEEVRVNSEIWIRGTTGAKIVPIPSPVTGVAFILNTANITITSMNISDFEVGIESDHCGHNISDNQFFLNTQDVSIKLSLSGLNSSFMTGGLVFSGNELKRNSAMHGVDIDLNIQFDYENASHADIGDIIITDNEMSSTETARAFFHIRETVSDMLGGSLTIGDVIMKGNRMTGGGTGFDFYGSIYELENVSVTVGDFIISGNHIVESDDYGIDLDYYDFTNLHGTTTVRMGDIMVSDNEITSSGNSNSIYLADFAYWYELHDDIDLETGNVTVEHNTLESRGYGVYLYYSYLGYSMDGNARAVTRNAWIRNNTILASSYGIYLDIEDGYENSGSSSCELGDIHVENNKINSTYDAIYVYLYYLGESLEENASFVMGDIIISGNTANGSQGAISYSGLSIYMEHVGADLRDRSRVRIGNIEVFDNTLSGTYGVYSESMYVVGSNNRGESSMEMGRMNITGNTMNGTDAGFSFYYMNNVGDDLSGNSTVSVKGIYVEDNDIIGSGTGYGIKISNLDNIADNLFESSSLSFGGINILNNNVSSASDGVFIEDIGAMAAGMSGDSDLQADLFDFSGNNIVCGGYGVVFDDDIPEFGRGMGGNSRAEMDVISIEGNRIVSSDTGILMGASGLGHSMDGSADLHLDTWTVTGNEITSGSAAVDLRISELGRGMISGNLDIAGISISDNVFDTWDGIKVWVSTDPLKDHANVSIGEILINDNVFLHASDDDTILVNVISNVGDNASFILDGTFIIGNDQSGSNVSVIHNSHSETVSGNGTSDLGLTRISRNNITYGGTGLELEGPKTAEVFLNNFMGNIDDVAPTSTPVSWVSPEPLWYRHGMRNFSSYLGNYWSSYTGPDNNNDGIGDNPFNTGSGLDTRPLMNQFQEVVPPWQDETPPEVRITSPSNGTIFDTGDVLIEWEAADDLLGIEDIWVRSDDGAWVEKGPLSGSHLFSNLTEGVHELFVRVMDPAGNENSTSVHVVVDLSPPVVWFVSPVNGSALNTSTIDVVWNGSDILSGIDHFELALDNGSYMDMGNASTHSFTNLSEGEHLLALKGVDKAGNGATLAITVLIDMEPPQITFIHPIDEMILTRNRVNITWNGDGGLTGMESYWISIDGGNFTEVGALTYHLVRDLTPGRHVFTVRGRDLAGNMGTASVSVNVDVSVPGVVIDYPENGAHINKTSFDATWTINGLVHPVMRVEYRLNGGNWTVVTGESVPLLDLAEGQYVLDVKATDIMGNADAGTSVFVVDVTSPLVVEVSHEGSSTSVRGPISITFSEVMNADTLIVSVNGENAFWELSGVELIIDTGELEAGTTYIVKVTGTDLAGNWIERDITFSTAAKGTVSGRIVNEDGEPVGGARIVFDTGEETETEDDGIFSISLPPGTRSATVYDKDGSVIGSFQVNVTAGEASVMEDVGVQPKEASEKGFPWWMVIGGVVLLLLILIGIAALVLVSRSKEAEEEFDEEIWEDDEDDEEEDDEDYYDDDEWDEDEDEY